MITVKLHGRNGTRAIKVKPKGFGTRHVRAPRETNPPAQPFLNRYPLRFVLSSRRSICSQPNMTAMATSSLMKSSSPSVRSAKSPVIRCSKPFAATIAMDEITFRRGYGSQLQFALKGGTA